MRFRFFSQAFPASPSPFIHLDEQRSIHREPPLVRLSFLQLRGEGLLLPGIHHAHVVLAEEAAQGVAARGVGVPDCRVFHSSLISFLSRAQAGLG